MSKIGVYITYDTNSRCVRMNENGTLIPVNDTVSDRVTSTDNASSAVDDEVASAAATMSSLSNSYRDSLSENNSSNTRSASSLSSSSIAIDHDLNDISVTKRQRALELRNKIVLKIYNNIP